MPDRIAAHTIVYGGTRYRLSSAYVDDDGRVRVEPLREETPNTIFINGTVEVEAIGGTICVKPDSKGSAL